MTLLMFPVCKRKVVTNSTHMTVSQISFCDHEKKKALILLTDWFIGWLVFSASAVLQSHILYSTYCFQSTDSCLAEHKLLYETFTHADVELLTTATALEASSSSGVMDEK